MAICKLCNTIFSKIHPPLSLLLMLKIYLVTILSSCKMSDYHLPPLAVLHYLWTARGHLLEDLILLDVCESQAEPLSQIDHPFVLEICFYMNHPTESLFVPGLQHTDEVYSVPHCNHFCHQSSRQPEFILQKSNLKYYTILFIYRDKILQCMMSIQEPIRIHSDAACKSWSKYTTDIKVGKVKKILVIISISIPC